MADVPTLRRSGRISNAIKTKELLQSNARGRKRTSQEAFAAASSSNIKTENPDDDQHPIEQRRSTVQDLDTATAYDQIKSEPTEAEQAGTDDHILPYASSSIRTELDESRVKPRRVMKAKRVKTELSDDASSAYEEPKRKSAAKPKRKPAAKKKKDPTAPYRLVVTADMIRPPGEKQPPMIYPVIKKPRDSKLPSLLSEMVANFSAAVKRARDKVPRLAPGEEETRLLPLVVDSSQRYHDTLERAASQRLFVLQRERSTEEDCHAGHHDCPIEDFLIAGSTGNVYTTTITHKPTCSCGDYIFRKHSCKHILYVLSHVLKVPDHLKHQDAFLSSELREIAAHAPPMPAVAKEDLNDGNRKPVEDDCPICCMAFEANEDIVWCQAACGNNVHKECFQKWAQSRPHNVTCPFCRTAWEKDTAKVQSMVMTEVNMPDSRNTNGYLNVADQLGYV